MKHLNHILESIVFVSGRAVEIKDIADKIGVTPKEILETAKEMQKTYSGECGLHLLIFNNKLQFSSNPEYAAQVEEVLNPIKERELSRAMLEVCAIIAYKQPITRLEIEELRGVNSDYAINLLSKHNIIEVVGRKDAIGKPLLFGTTDEFLKRFQLQSLKELPDYDELLNRIQVLHTQTSTDLFHKDEYDPEQDEEENRAQTISDAAATEEISNTLSVDSSAPEKIILQEQNLPMNEDEAAVLDSSEDEEEELPDFLKGETLIEVNGEEDAVSEFLPKEELVMIDETNNDEDIPDFLKGEDYIEIK